MTDETKKLFIKTYGCQMNVYDSERMTDVLAPLGYVSTDSPDDADMVILNTCHIREKAAEKVYSELGRLRKLKDRRGASGQQMIVGVAGCVAQAEGEEMVRRAPVVDMVFGPQTYHRLPEMVARASRRETGVLDTEFPVKGKFDYLVQPDPQVVKARGVSAFVTIQEGCDKFCTFCVVPYTRGAEYSRPVAKISDEVRQRAAAGVREITLLGQNVNAYHGEAPSGNQCGLADLLRELADIDGIERLRYTTSHPRDVDDRLIAVHRDIPQVMPYLHLPVQSGSDRILEAMNRRHTGTEYRDIVDRLRAARPDLALSSDFIVGFPGETDGDFEATLQLVRDVTFAQAYSFKYSPRPGTPAATMADQVPEQAKSERLTVLQNLLNEQQMAFNTATVGKTVPVLLEKPGRRDGQLVGRSAYLQAVHVDADIRMIGEIAGVTIVAAGPNSLSARLTAPSFPVTESTVSAVASENSQRRGEPVY